MKPPQVICSISETSIADTFQGMLTFTTYYLVKNPHVLQKAQAEIDRVVGKGPIKYEHMSKLPYLEATMRESLRMSPTSPAFAMKSLKPTEPTTLGEYVLNPDTTCMVWLNTIGRDPEVYGEDANVFKPERMMEPNLKNIPASAFKVSW